MKKFLYFLILLCLFSIAWHLSTPGLNLIFQENGENNKLKAGFSSLEEEGNGNGLSAKIPVSPSKAVYSQATVAVVGDIMVHRTQFVRAYDPQEGSYDFTPSFETITPYLQEADLIVGNLETTLYGEKQSYSAYPRFNSPDEIITALREAGFNLLCTANNHCLDTGEEGLYRTIEVIEEAGIKHFGTARSIMERDTPLVVEVNGISLSFLAYTYGTNGLPVPPEKGYLVNLLDTEQMIADIFRAKGKGADLVILYLHWGEEYSSEPTEEQKRIARVAAEAGADIILGSHPHVIQTMEYLSVPENGGGEKKVLVAYSMGNFISNQHRIPGSIPTDEVEIGKILYLDLEKNEGTGETYLKDISYRLTWVHRNDKHRILPLYSISGGGIFEDEGSLPEFLVERLEKDMERIHQRLDGFREAGPAALSR